MSPQEEETIYAGMLALAASIKKLTGLLRANLPAVGREEREVLADAYKLAETTTALIQARSNADFHTLKKRAGIR